ncbi:hypothetical protein PQX77_017865 [Marasmius sp. AFHP31]|nr:hypothetical protein PQX77_017865 [Marasmius sp. AFHP31]
MLAAQDMLKSEKCPDTKNLRLANRRVYGAVEHVLWKTHVVSVKIGTNGLSAKNVPMLEDFKSGYKTSELIRTLRIAYHRWRLAEDKPFGVDLVLSAIRNLKNVRTVEWDARLQAEIPDCIMHSLGYFSLLEELVLDCHRVSMLPSDTFRWGELKKISIKGDPSEIQDGITSSLAQIIHSNTKLSHLTIDWYKSHTPPIPLLPFSTLFDPALPAALPLQTLRLALWKFDFGHPNVAPHLKHLHSLDLIHCDYQDDMLWKMLSAQQLSLRRINVQVISHELLDYVESISGLEEFYLASFEPEDPILSEELSERLFQHVLPKHQHTLRILCIEPRMESLEWAICYHNMHFLDLYKGLTHLTIGLGFEFEDEDEPSEVIHARRDNVIVKIIDPPTNFKSPKTRALDSGISPDYEDYNLDLDGLLWFTRIAPEDTAIPHFEVSVNRSIFRAKIEMEYLDWTRKDGSYVANSYIAFSANNSAASMTEDRVVFRTENWFLRDFLKVDSETVMHITVVSFCVRWHLFVKAGVVKEWALDGRYYGCKFLATGTKLCVPPSMVAVSICSLPDELLEAVALHCSDTKNLRLVNRRVYGAIEHVLWQNHAVNVKIGTNGLSEKNVPMLEDFKSGSKTSESIRTLKIAYHRLRRLEDKPLGLDLVLSAMRNLKNVRTVEWDATLQAELPDCVMHPLEHFSLLEELVLDCRHVPVLPSGPFRWGELKKIFIKGDPSEVQDSVTSSLAQIIRSNTKLSHLTIDWLTWHTSPIPMLPFSTLFDPALPTVLPLQTLRLTLWKFDFRHPNVTPHLRHLHSLDLIDCDYRDDMLWKMLSAQQLSLRRINVQKISHELFDYVESISGLEELCLTFFEPEDPVLFEELSERLLHHVLPKHQHTLRILCIEPKMESLEWAICYHNMHFLDLYKGLTHLTIGLGFEFEDEDEPYEVITTRRQNVMKSLILQLTSNHPKLERLTLASLPDYEDYNLDLDGLLWFTRIAPEDTAIPHFEISIDCSIFRAKIETEYLDWARKDDPQFVNFYIAFRRIK